MRYKVNRPVTAEDLDKPLRQGERSVSEPMHDLSLIKMNSTFLECVEFHYSVKGVMSGYMFVAIGFFIFLIILFSAAGINKYLSLPSNEIAEMIATTISVNIVWCFCIAFAIFFMRIGDAAFQYTHYPMRFNRKTRMVHFFIYLGKSEVVSVPWDEMYFHQAPSAGHCYVRGHQLSPDGKTLLNTVSLPQLGVPWLDTRHAVWEYIRRYMEEPDSLPYLTEQVTLINDIADRRETFKAGYMRLSRLLGNGLLAVVVTPLILLFSVGRWFAMRTSKIPQWPAEIEAVCQIEPGDPYIRDRDHLAEDFRLDIPDVKLPD